MSNVELFNDGQHKNILLEDVETGGIAVQANQHVIIIGNEAMILDPGGHKAYNKVMSSLSALIPMNQLKYIFLSHQDPDIVAATNGWLMTTDADAMASALWARFIPHFGLDRLVAERLKSIPDEGQVLTLGGSKLQILPAHFLHSCGNFHVYDPHSKILYTGDLGASIGCDYREVTDFAAHLPKMEGFHKRYMAGNAAMRAWANMAATLDIEIIAPQHGAMMRGKPIVGQFIAWARELRCGIDLIGDSFNVPPL